MLIPSGFHLDHRKRMPKYQNLTEIPWKERQFKAFWRGGATGFNIDGDLWCLKVPWASN